MANKPKTLYARQLRKDATLAEQLLWPYLRDRNLFGKKFRRQHVFLGFILDFYCPAHKLAIELDGSVHLKQKDYDSFRQNIIENRGVKVLRFTNSEIFNSINKVIKTIQKHLN